MADAPHAPAAAPTLALRPLPARAGLAWVQQGIAACARNPLGFAALLMVTTLGFNLVARVPLIGPPVALATMPYVWLVFMRATRLTLAGQRFGLQVLGDVWRVPPERRNALARVSALYMAAMLGAALLVLLVYAAGADPEAVDRIRKAATPDELSAALAANSRLWACAALMAALLGLVSMAFWHAPALAHALAMRPMKALFFSIMACWHNRGAFFLYGLAWGGLGFAVMFVSGLAGQLLQSDAAAAVIAVPGLLLLMASFYASLHFSTADCFQAQFPE